MFSIGQQFIVNAQFKGEVYNNGTIVGFIETDSLNVI